MAIDCASDLAPIRIWYCALCTARMHMALREPAATVDVRKAYEGRPQAPDVDWLTTQNIGTFRSRR